MNTYGTGQYRQTQVSTVDKGRLIVLLYEGAVKFLREAIEAHEQGDIPAKANYINRALDIINELSQSLNINDGGEIAINLKRIYLFWTEHLLKAKVGRDAKPMEDVIEMMSSLIGAWQSVCNDAEASKLAGSGTGAGIASMTAGRTA